MRGERTPPWAGYLTAGAATALAALVRWAMTPILNDTTFYHFFYVSAVLTAVGWGRGPGLLATVLGALAGTWMYVGRLGHPELFATDGYVRLIIFLGVGTSISFLAGLLRAQYRRVDQQRGLLAVTLASIGDGVIVTDRQGRITFLNHEAERLTGWTGQEAVGQPLPAIFRVHEDGLHSPMGILTDDGRLLETEAGQVNHLVLVAKDGREISVSVNRATIRDVDGTVRGEVLVLRDTTKQEQTQKALREAVELRQIALDTAKMGTWEIDPESLLCTVDARCQVILGIPEDRFHYERFLASLHPEDRQRVDEATRRAFAPEAEGRYEAEYRVVHADGAIRWVTAKGQTFFEGEGESRRAVRVVGTVADITERKQAEEKRLASEELLQQAVDISGLGIFDYDFRSGIVKWSPRLREMRGVGPDEPVSTAVLLERVHPEDRQKVVEAIARAEDPEGDGLYLVENRVRWPDGTIRWLSQRGQEFFEGEGPTRRCVRVVGAVLDITERKLAEEGLRASEELFRAFFDNAAVGTSLLEPNGKFLLVNDRYCEITGYRREELLKMTPDELYHPDDRQRYEELLAPLRQGRTSLYRMEQRRVRKDGRVIWVQVDVSLIRDSEGRPFRVAGIIQDITARKETEAALAAARQNAEQAKAAAEAANQAKSRFLAHMSHELRTPMNSILGMTDLALQETQKPAVRDYLQTVKDSAESLLILINEILDLSRIEAGALSLESTPFRVRSLLDDILKALALRAFEKHLELACYVAPAVPDRLVSDPLRIRQILTNLLGNAIKFTEEGEVVLQVELEAETPEEVRLRFVVSDTGIGIAPEHQQRIFAPFTQADHSMTRRFGGSGLGLSIVSRLVDMLGGEVGLESQLGKGSTFFVRLPLRRSGESESPDPQELFLERQRGCSVLVADRHGVNRRILGQILSGWGMRPVLVEDSSSALTQLRAACSTGRRFSVVFLDASICGIEGLDSLKQIQADLQITVPVVLTVSPVERQRFGAQPILSDPIVFLEKPISPLSVATALSQALGAAVHEEASSIDVPEEAAGRPLRILLAEDTPASQKLAVHILSRRGHTVEIAQNGQEAVQRLDRERFDLVLMDVQMPVMDGIQATAEIRRMQSSDKAHIPIVAMTAHALKGDQELCLDAGMDAYISKPIDGRELIALVERLGNSPRTQDLPTPGPLEVPEAVGTTASVDMSSREPFLGCETVDFDFDAAVQKCFGKYELFQEMVACFLSEVEQLVEQMHAALAGGDGEEAYRAAHRLKNTVVYLGATSAVEATTQVERFCLAGNLTAATQALGALEQQLSRLKPVLAEYRHKPR